MYAVVSAGGRQYSVKKGDIIDMEIQYSDDADRAVEFKDVLFVKDETTTFMGEPVLNDWIVKGEYVEEVKGPKVVSFKYKRRKNYKLKKGHRQRHSRIRITDIVRTKGE